jgi:hypothetical protein
MTSGGSDRSNGSGGRTRVVLSPERKQAMVQVGAIDNSGSILNRDKYTRILKGYAEFDRINGAAR